MFNVHLQPLSGVDGVASNDDGKAVFISGPNASDTGNIYLAGSGSVDLNCSNCCDTSGSFATPGFLPCNLFFFLPHLHLLHLPPPPQVAH